MKTFKFSLVLRTRENTDVFITLDKNIYSSHSKRVNILYICENVSSAPSDRGLRCPQTESMDTIDRFNGEQMPAQDFAHVQANANIQICL